MKTLNLSVICLILTFGLACSGGKKELSEKKKDIQQIVVIDDGYKTTAEGELLIDDSVAQAEALDTKDDNKSENTQILDDGSRLTVMYDGFGNKTITRFFNNHPLISGIVLRNSQNGETKTFIYTKDGLVKTVNEDYQDKIFTLSANTVAKNAEIFQLDKNAVFRPAQPQTSASNQDNDALYISEVGQPVTSDPDQSIRENVSEVEKRQEPNNVAKSEKVAESTNINEFEPTLKKTNPTTARN